MSVEPYDDASISAVDIIIRRIDPENHLAIDYDSGEKRISTKAVRPSNHPGGGMSVDLERLIKEAGLDPKEFVITPKFKGAIAIQAEAIRANRMWIGKDALDENPYHGEVWNNGDKKNKFSKAQQKQLLRSCEWYVELEGVNIPK